MYLQFDLNPSFSNLAAHWNHPGALKPNDAWMSAQGSDLIDLGYGLGIEIFQTPQVITRLKTTEI